MPSSTTVSQASSVFTSGAPARRTMTRQEPQTPCPMQPTPSTSVCPACMKACRIELVAGASMARPSMLRRTQVFGHVKCAGPDGYFVTAIDLRNSATL